MLESEEKDCPLECPILLVLPWRMCPARECERSKPETRFFRGDGGGGIGTGIGGGPMDRGALEAGWVCVAIGMVGALRPGGKRSVERRDQRSVVRNVMREGCRAVFVVVYVLCRWRRYARGVTELECQLQV